MYTFPTQINWGDKHLFGATKFIASRFPSEAANVGYFAMTKW